MLEADGEFLTANQAYATLSSRVRGVLQTATQTDKNCATSAFPSPFSGRALVHVRGRTRGRDMPLDRKREGKCKDADIAERNAQRRQHPHVRMSCVHSRSTNSPRKCTRAVTVTADARNNRKRGQRVSGADKLVAISVL